MSKLVKASNQKYVTTGEASRRLGVSIPTVVRMATRGELAAVRIGRWLRINVADLERIEEVGSGTNR